MENKSEKKTMINIREVKLSFGGTNALSFVNLEVKDNELMALIGPNGSGKTSLLNCITGYYATRGSSKRNSTIIIR